ncbi:MAG: hypothetical protein WC310_05315 [Patescibacteria group bacterium]
MMKFFYSKPVLVSLATLLTCFFIVAPFPSAVAQDNDGATGLQGASGKTEIFSEKLGYQPSDDITPEIVIGRLIGYVLGFLGVVFFVLVVYGGWKWLLAKGNEDQITEAKDLITHSITGLAIVFAAYLLSWVVLSFIMQTVSPSG